MRAMPRAARATSIALESTAARGLRNLEECIAARRTACSAGRHPRARNDEAVRTLDAAGMLHNHARMWLAGCLVHLREVHWRVAADWPYGHLLDGDLASNRLGWQWMAATGSGRPHRFDADHVARHAPEPWHSPGSVIDTACEALERTAWSFAPPDRGRFHAARQALLRI